MERRGEDPRPKRTSSDQTPCLADPSLACVPECGMYDPDARIEAINEAGQELPPITDVLSHHPEFDDPGAQTREEQIYYNRRWELLAPNCDIE